MTKEQRFFPNRKPFFSLPEDGIPTSSPKLSLELNKFSSK